MRTQANYRQGNLNFYDRDLSPVLGTSLWENCPLLAIRSDPSVGFEFFDDFLQLTKAADNWILTQATTGTAVAGVLAGGVASLGAGATTDGQGPQIQLGGVDFFPAAGKHIWYETRLKCNVLTVDLAIGLFELDTTLIDTTDLTTANGIGFKTFTGNGVILGTSEKATAEGTVAALHTLAADTYVKLGFYVDGVTSVTFFVNGVANATTLLTANIPVVGLTPSYSCHATGTGTPQLDVDWVRAVQLR